MFITELLVQTLVCCCDLGVKQHGVCDPGLYWETLVETFWSEVGFLDLKEHHVALSRWQHHDLKTRLKMSVSAMPLLYWHIFKLLWLHSKPDMVVRPEYLGANLFLCLSLTLFTLNRRERAEGVRCVRYSNTSKGNHCECIFFVLCIWVQLQQLKKKKITLFIYGSLLCKCSAQHSLNNQSKRSRVCGPKFKN